MSQTLTPIERPESVQDQASIRDRHVDLQYALFELGRAYAEEKEAHNSHWKSWCKVNFGWTTPRSIANVIAIYEAFCDSQEAVGNIDLAALGILSRRGTEKARALAVAEAEAGRYVTEEDAKHLVALHR